MFINLFVSNGRSNNPFFYHVFPKPENNKIPDTTIEREKGYVLLTHDDLENYGHQDPAMYGILKINPLKLSSPVNLINYPDGVSCFIVKSINPESITKE